MAVLESFVSMRDERSALSHFSKIPVVWNGYEFPTSEHACRAAMFMWSEPDVFFRILRARTPSNAISIAHKHTLSRRADWDDVRVQLTQDICGAKHASACAGAQSIG